MVSLSAAVTTPFTDQGEIDLKTFREHVVTLMNSGVNNITFFGTTGEGPSISFNEKLGVLSYLCPKYLDPENTIVAVICSNSDDARNEINSCNTLGIHRFLIAPPHFFRDPSVAGLKKWFSSVFSTFVETNNNFLLYNIPQLTGVFVDNNLISELQKEFGSDLIFGVKDSSGDIMSARSYLTNNKLMVAIGDERLIAQAVSYGASGSICGLSNIFPRKILQILQSGSKNEQINSLIADLLKYPITPGVKAVLALKTQNDLWLNVRPPLIKASTGQINRLKPLLKNFCD